jgi:serine/threonine protein kinase
MFEPHVRLRSLQTGSHEDAMARSYARNDQPVPGYVLVEFLGRGGFGEVWKASAPGGAECALKIINLSCREGLKEFKAISLLRRVHHPNLTPIIAIWVKDTRGRILPDDAALITSQLLKDQEAELIVAMGLGEKNLATRLKECEARGLSGIPVHELLSYMEDAAKGIDFLARPGHDVGSGPASIQHCDIKPQNILIVGGSAQVCDFGLARQIDDLRQTSFTAGSLAYMAPEQISGVPTGATDQYSLAVTYIELRTCRLPFTTSNMAALMMDRATGKIDLTKLPPAEQPVLRKATAVKPEERFATTMEMVRALRIAVEGRTSSQGEIVVRGDPLPTGTEVVPGYHLLDLIGRGGYGEVWRALAPGEKLIAVKIIRYLESGGGKHELRAMELLKNIDHIYLMELQAFWLLDQQGQIIPDAVRKLPDSPPACTLVVATKLADKNLLQRLYECQDQQGGQGGIPLPELLNYMRQAAEAIDFLNESRHPWDGQFIAIQHRDIKPQNILLHAGTIKVTDFGLAKVMQRAAEQIQADSAGLSVHYAAPEIFDDRVTAWTDQYSLAITYCHLRTGKLPFQANSSPQDIKNIHIGGRLDFSALPATEQYVLLRATRLNPRGRFPSCTAMVTALEKASQAPSGKKRPWRKRVNLLMEAAILLALAVLLPALGLAAYNYFNRQTTPAQQRPGAEAVTASSPVAPTTPEDIPVPSVDLPALLTTMQLAFAQPRLTLTSIGKLLPEMSFDVGSLVTFQEDLVNYEADLDRMLKRLRFEELLVRARAAAHNHDPAAFLSELERAEKLEADNQAIAEVFGDVAEEFAPSRKIDLTDLLAVLKFAETRRLRLNTDFYLTLAGAAERERKDDWYEQATSKLLMADLTIPEEERYQWMLKNARCRARLGRVDSALDRYLELVRRFVEDRPYVKKPVEFYADVLEPALALVEPNGLTAPQSEGSAARARMIAELYHGKGKLLLDRPHEDWRFPEPLRESVLAFERAKQIYPPWIKDTLRARIHSGHGMALTQEHELRGRSLTTLPEGELAKVREDWVEALAIDADHYWGWSLKGLYYYVGALKAPGFPLAKADLFARSIEAYETAIHTPGQENEAFLATSLTACSVSYFERANNALWEPKRRRSNDAIMNDLRAAKEYAQLALRFPLERKRTLCTLGRIYIVSALSDPANGAVYYREAARNFREALRIRPAYFDAQISLAECHIRYAKTIKKDAAMLQNAGELLDEVFKNDSHNSRALLLKAHLLSLSDTLQADLQRETPVIIAATQAALASQTQAGHKADLYTILASAHLQRADLFANQKEYHTSLALTAIENLLDLDSTNWAWAERLATLRESYAKDTSHSLESRINALTNAIERLSSAIDHSPRESLIKLRDDLKGMRKRLRQEQLQVSPG